MNSTKKLSTLAVLACVALSSLSTGCAGLYLRHVGYAATNKVWYHWTDQNGTTHKLVVCDVQADGSEANCKESDI